MSAVKIMWFGTAKWRKQVKDTRHGLLYMGPTCLVVGLPIRISYN